MRIKWMVALAATLILSGCGGVADKARTNPGSPSAAYGSTPKTTVIVPQGPAPTPAGNKKQWSAPPAMQIDPAKQYYATLKTSLGNIKIELFAKDAPKTVNNFVFLAKDGFYDGLIFHRIVKDFMIQGGDPVGTCGGGPGYKFADELPVKRSYDPGIVAMANAGPNTNGSQFFICNGAGCKGLDQQPNYTQFGKVVEGMDVVLKISAVETVRGSDGAMSRPKVPPVIQTITIEVK